jgi:hypothetical protein
MNCKHNLLVYQRVESSCDVSAKVAEQDVGRLQPFLENAAASMLVLPELS